MRMWFELGKKIGWIELSVKLCSSPDTLNMLISPHDIEDIHYEILDCMKEMELDNSKIAESKIEEYERIALGQIKRPYKKTKRQLFLLGYYAVKLKILLANDLNDVFNESRKELLGYIIERIDSLKLSNSLKSISIDEYREKDFERIEDAVINSPLFDGDEPLRERAWRHRETRGEMVLTIILTLITVAATIIAAIISKS